MPSVSFQIAKFYDVFSFSNKYFTLPYVYPSSFPLLYLLHLVRFNVDTDGYMSLFLYLPFS